MRSIPATWTPTCTGRRSRTQIRRIWPIRMMSRAPSFDWRHPPSRPLPAGALRRPRLGRSPARPLPAPPAERRASLPAELRGRRRDGVRLMVIDRAAESIKHSAFTELDSHLRAHDLLVINRSRTIPAAFPARRDDGTPVQLRLCVRLAEEWHVLCVQPEPPHANLELRPSEPLQLDGREPLVRGRRADLPLLWRIDAVPNGLEYLLAGGQPIRYSYVPDPVPMSYYQTVYAVEPGSAETPSAGRAFSWELLRALRQRRVALTDVL